jgi:hypothetical protein
MADRPRMMWVAASGSLSDYTTAENLTSHSQHVCPSPSHRILAPGGMAPFDCKQIKRLYQRVAIGSDRVVDLVLCVLWAKSKNLWHAQFLIAKGHQQAARELNRAVSVLGENVEPGVVTSRIQIKFFGGRLYW